MFGYYISAGTFQWYHGGILCPIVLCRDLIKSQISLSQTGLIAHTSNTRVLIKISSGNCVIRSALKPDATGQILHRISKKKNTFFVKPILPAAEQFRGDQIPRVPTRFSKLAPSFPPLNRAENTRGMSSRFSQLQHSFTCKCGANKRRWKKTSRTWRREGRKRGCIKMSRKKEGPNKSPKILIQDFYRACPRWAIIWPGQVIEQSGNEKRSELSGRSRCPRVWFRDYDHVGKKCLALPRSVAPCPGYGTCIMERVLAEKSATRDCLNFRG